MLNCNLKLSLSESALFDFLKQQKPPVIETTLLRKFFPIAENRSFREMDLPTVQMHFILYHHLYKLAHFLRQTDYLLYIYYIYSYLFKKPDKEHCPHFNEWNTRFCLAEKEEDHFYCQYHLEKEEHVVKMQSLKPRGIEEYYLNFDNFNSLENEYPHLKNQVQKIKEYSLFSHDLEAYFDLLGLDYGVPFDKVQQRYKALAKQFHPDLNSSPEACRKFQAITHAFDCVKDFLDQE